MSTPKTAGTNYGQAATIGGKPIKAKTTFTPAPKESAGKPLTGKGGTALPKDTTAKKVFKSENIKSEFPSSAKAELSAKKKEEKEKRVAERAAEKAKRDSERTEAKKNKPAKIAKDHVVKNEFVVAKKCLVYDGMIVSSQQAAVVSAVKRYLVAKGWDFTVELVKNEATTLHELSLTPKMEQDNISRQRNVLSGFVSGYLDCLNQ